MEMLQKLLMCVTEAWRDSIYGMQMGNKNLLLVQQTY